jgi:hypothetical protein
MRRKSIYRVIALAVVLVFAFSTSGLALERGDEPGAEQMVIPDLLIGRPVGLIALGTGTVIYVVTLPITLIFGWHKKASESLVKKPYRFTFRRELGEGLAGRR